MDPPLALPEDPRPPVLRVRPGLGRRGAGPGRRRRARRRASAWAASPTRPWRAREPRPRWPASRWTKPAAARRARTPPSPTPSPTATTPSSPSSAAAPWCARLLEAAATWRSEPWPTTRARRFGRPDRSASTARAKVTGAARYASDEPVANPAFAYLVTSSIARGRVTGFDLAEARAVPGVLDILTHENVGGQIKAAAVAQRPGHDHHHPGIRPGLARRPDRRRGRRRHLRGRARGGAQGAASTMPPRRPSATFDSPGVADRSVAEAQAKARGPQGRRRRRRLRRRAGEDRRALLDPHPAPQPHRAVHHHLCLGRRRS